MTTQSRRVVVTGVGLVTPLGATAHATWSSLIAGTSGISSLPSDHPVVVNQLPCTIAGRVQRSQLPALQSPNTTSLFTHYAMIAANEALVDSGYDAVAAAEDGRSSRAGAAIGSGIGDLLTCYETSVTIHERGYRKVSPFFVPKVLINMAAAEVCRNHSFHGPCHAVSTACATGAHAIGDASRFIIMNDADVMLAGGTEACIDLISMSGFARMRALATGYNDDPTRASRPFDRDRGGFVMGEGAGVLVLEEYEHARKRGARIYAELSGYGASTDAYHITQPNPSGIGAVASMKMALRHACIDSYDQVQYVNAHATSTPIGDEIEERAINDVFTDGVMVSSTKGATGHLLGAAGAVEAAFTVLALHNRVIPPTCNLDNISLESAGNIVHTPHTAVDNADLRVAVCNSFGFGSTNASLVFRRLS